MKKLRKKARVRGYGEEGNLYKKAISIVTLMAFVIFSISCYPLSTKEIRTEADWQGKEFKRGKIIWVIKTSGEYIEFSKDNPGWICEDKIEGEATLMSKKVEIERANIKRIKKHSDGRIFEVINKEGKIYNAVGLGKEEDDKFIIYTAYTSSESVSIPLSDVKLIRIKKLNYLLTAMVMVGSYGVLSLIILYSSLSPKWPFRTVWK